MFKWWCHYSIFLTLTFFTFLIIFITSSQTWIKYLNFILLNEVITMLYISIKFIKCNSLFNMWHAWGWRIDFRYSWWSLSHTWYWKVLGATIWNHLWVTFFYKCDIWVDMRWYYAFCYFILKTLQTDHNFWHHYCS